MTKFDEISENLDPPGRGGYPPLPGGSPRGGGGTPPSPGRDPLLPPGSGVPGRTCRENFLESEKFSRGPEKFSEVRNFFCTSKKISLHKNFSNVKIFFYKKFFCNKKNFFWRKKNFSGRKKFFCLQKFFLLTKNFFCRSKKVFHR